MLNNYIKKIKSFFKIYVLSFLGFIVIFIVNKTIRWNAKFLDGKDKFPKKGVIVFWHAHQLLMAPISKKIFFKGRKNIKISVLISQHSDGRLIAMVMKYFKYGSVAGSSTNNSRASSLKLLKNLKEDNSYIGITPDGPKGPRCKMKMGAITLASLSNMPIVPVAYDFEKKWIFNSWDKMFFPKLFSKGNLIVGKVFYLKENLTEEELEKYKDLVENELNNISKMAQNYEC